MGKFKGKWSVEEYGPRLVITTQEISYTTDEGVTHVVEKGFISDGGSIPPIAWPIIGSPFVGYYRKSVLGHDKLYATQKYSRKYSDRTFIEAMRDEGVPLWKRMAMWSYVKALGWYPWNKQAKRLKKEKKD